MTPEMMRPQPVAAVGPDGLARSFAADARERAALARRFDVRRLDRLDADLTLRHEPRGLRVRGTVSAAGAQTCRVSGRAVDFALAQDVNCLYVVDPKEVARAFAPDEDGDLEYLAGDSVDLGELAAQIFAMALEPYPRCPDLPPLGSAAPQREEASPFAILAALKDRG